MIKQLFCSLATLTLAATGFAATLSPEQALKRYESACPQQARKAPASSLKLAFCATARDGAPAAYVFTREGHSGFSILSASEAAAPLLGYSDDGLFDKDNVPAPLKGWLSEIGRRIEFIESKGVSYDDAPLYAPEDWTAIEPLVKTKWNQDAPYNKMTPSLNGAQTPTGCVATSFAQVLNYFQYPERGTGILTYQWGTKKLRMNLETTPFQWDKMLDSYTTGSYTDEQADAVATLMKACGYSVEMNYGADASGAQSYKIAIALRDYFKYDPSVTYEDRTTMSYNQWTTKIYENIKNLGPVIYDGTSIDGGHSFICDGYDGNGYFHFNWGWGGVSDGYYLLDVLNPEAQGTGGSLGGFNYSQDAVFGIQKPTGKPTPIVYGNLTQWGTSQVEAVGKTLNWNLKGYEPTGWANQSGGHLDVSIFAEFQPINGGTATYAPFRINRNGETWSDNHLDLGHGYYIKYPETVPVVDIPETLGNGDYKVTFVVLDNTKEDAPYQPVETYYGYTNYCFVKVDGGTYTVSNEGPFVLDFKDVVIGRLYSNKNTMITATVDNDSDLDLSCCVQPVLVRNGKTQYLADNFIVSVPAGETVSNKWIVKFYLAADADDYGTDQTYTLRLQNRTTGEIIGTYGDVEMEYNGSSLKIAIDDFFVENASQKVDITLDDKNFKDVYVADNTGDVEVVLDYTVQSGFFDSSLSMGIQWFNPETGKYETVKDQIYRDYPFLGGGDKGQAKANVDMSNLNPNGVFQVRAYYVANGRNQSLGSMYFSFSTDGVEDIIADKADGNVEYFNLQGARIENPEAGMLVIERKNGKSVKKIMK